MEFWSPQKVGADNISAATLVEAILKGFPNPSIFNHLGKPNYEVINDTYLLIEVDMDLV